MQYLLLAEPTSARAIGWTQNETALKSDSMAACLKNISSALQYKMAFGLLRHEF